MTGSVSTTSVGGNSGLYPAYGENQNRAEPQDGSNRHPNVEEAEGVNQPADSDKNLNLEEADEEANRLTPKEQDQVRKLAARDSQVRAHEAAHLAAAGSLASGGASFSFQKGPDGKFYAIGGEVQIDTSPGSNPQETQSKSRQIRAAALAPADPSPQDLKVAAAASTMEISAAKKIQNPATEGEQPKSADIDETTARPEKNSDHFRNLSENLKNTYQQDSFPVEPSVFEIRV